jgi:hypothetical protein
MVKRALQDYSLDASTGSHVQLMAKMLVADNALIDIDRAKRKGFVEVVFAQGKKSHDIVRIFECFIEAGTLAVATRVSDEQAEILLERFSVDGAWFPDARVFIANKSEIPAEPYPTSIGILTAGLTDRVAAEEAAQLLAAAHYPVEKVFDVGVAGLHRLLVNLERVKKCDVVIVAAGMEGALPTVVAGLIEQPVIALPTSVGYGISQNGTTALHSMLASCSPGIAVVNIDNGYGAAMMAHAICNRIHKGVRGKREEE